MAERESLIELPIVVLRMRNMRKLKQEVNFSPHARTFHYLQCGVTVGRKGFITTDRNVMAFITRARDRRG